MFLLRLHVGRIGESSHSGGNLVVLELIEKSWWLDKVTILSSLMQINRRERAKCTCVLLVKFNAS